jgi:hypothetical protein
MASQRITGLSRLEQRCESFVAPPQWMLAALTVLLDKEVGLRNRSIFAAFVVSVLLGLSPLAADSTIQRGIDVFTTTANGTTFIDFAQNAGGLPPLLVAMTG